MDWKTFISNIVHSLAWPAVAGVLLYVLRHQLPELLKRLKGASLGANKIEFSEALDEAEKAREFVAVQDPGMEVNAEQFDELRLKLAKEFPEAAIMLAYKDVEKVLLEVRSRLDLQPRTNLRSIVRRLVEKKIVRSEVEPLMVRFQEARNAAVHAKGDGKVSPGQALEYMAQAQFLSSLFSNAIKRL